MKIIPFILLLFSGITLMFTGTGCDGDDDRLLASIDPISTAYCVFKQGSWWAYQNTTTKAMDTVSIYRVESGVQSIPDFLSYDFEEEKMYTIWSSFGHDLTKANPHIRVSAQKTNGVDAAWVEEKTPTYVGPNLIFYPFSNVGDSDVLIGNDTIRYEKFYDTLRVAGEDYRNVMEFSTTMALSTDKAQRLYWAMNVGRIKFITFGGDTLELVDYQAIQ